MKLNMPKVMILGNFRSRFSQGRRRAVGAGEFEVCGNLRNTKGREGAEEKKKNPSCTLGKHQAGELR